MDCVGEQREGYPSECATRCKLFSIILYIVIWYKELHGLHMRYEGGPMNSLVCSKWKVPKR